MNSDKKIYSYLFRFLVKNKGTKTLGNSFITPFSSNKNKYFHNVHCNNKSKFIVLCHNSLQIGVINYYFAYSCTVQYDFHKFAPST